MKLGKEYMFRDDLFDPDVKGTTTPIELKIDPFKGIVYRYTTIEIDDKKEDDPRLIFDYEIVEAPDVSMSTLRNNSVFELTIGKILQEIIRQAIETDGMNEVRTNNTEKLDNEGGLY